MKPENYIPRVRDQYEAFPYPARSPLDERRTLFRTWLDDLPMINHYCYAGKQTFRERFRALVAGGGTGDATIFLAEQLRDTDAEVVHVDLSEASIAIARERAKMRGLNGIIWINASLLDLPALGIGDFDYVNCAGVLHHLEDPDAGLRALLAVTKPCGALGLMVYALSGRAGVYQMQSLLRLINGEVMDARQQILNAREVLGAVPKTNWFKRGEDLFEDHRLGDAGLYDLLLHSQDRAYSVLDLYEWVEDRHGLHLYLSDVGRGRAAYQPELALGPQPPHFLAAVARMPTRVQYAIGELLRGDVITHSFFATRAPDTCAKYCDPEYVPFLFHEPVTGPELAALIESNHSRPFVLNHVHTGITVKLDPGKYAKYVLRHLDGKRAFADIFERVRHEPALNGSAPTDDELFEDFRPVYDFLTSIERLLLRHRSVAC